jgi:hypothetical protein
VFCHVDNHVPVFRDLSIDDDSIKVESCGPDDMVSGPRHPFPAYLT